jgi:hypothetical protein
VGANPDKPEFACGDVVDENNGNNFETHHQVWFKGSPPSKEFVEARLI